MSIVEKKIEKKVKNTEKKTLLATEILLTTNVFSNHLSIKYLIHSVQLIKIFRRNK